MNKEKLLHSLLTGSYNISFSDMTSLVESFGFELARTKGSHHIYKHHEIKELINIQNEKGKAKPYQIKQFLQLIEKYNLKLGE